MGHDTALGRVVPDDVRVCQEQHSYVLQCSVVVDMRDVIFFFTPFCPPQKNKLISSFQPNFRSSHYNEGSGMCKSGLFEAVIFEKLLSAA